MKQTFLLRSFLAAYRLLWSCLTPFLLRSGRIREGAAERTLQEVAFSRVDLWIHAASAGEAYLAGQIVECLDSGQPLDILITTNTSQGRIIVEKNIGSSVHRVTVSFMVFDNPSLVKRAVKIADPKLLVLVELEIWPALMAEMKRAGKKVMIVNGRMTEKSFKGYRKAALLWRQLKPDTILAISESDRRRFVTLFDQPETFHVANMKFDRMGRGRIDIEKKQEYRYLVLASVRKEEDSEVLYLVDELLAQFPDLRIGLFPRHMHRVDNWGKLLTKKKISWALKSAERVGGDVSVVIWDLFGELENEFSRADAVFVGGSLASLGGQNFIEPLLHGVAPVTGPSVSDFLWVGEELFNQGLVQKGSSKEDVLRLLADSLKYPADKIDIRLKVDRYIAAKQGGSRKTCDFINSLMKK
jgi:3-deoxy-D-manno-octulosonic-acid transferase